MRDQAAQRTNQEWLVGLRDSGHLGGTVQTELHGLLKRVLSKALRPGWNVDQAAIEDFTQDAILTILTKLDKFRGDSQFTTWASAVAIRTALTALRRAHWQDVPLDEALVEFESITDPGPRVDTQVEQHEISAAIYRTIERDLTEQQRRVLLAELNGVPRDMLVEKLGTNPNALYKLAHDARKRLRVGLERDGFGADDVRKAFDE